MKALFVGLGSIGLRHLNNLTNHCKAQGLPLQVTALRSSDRALPPEAEPLLAAQIQELPQNVFFDIAFITNPTNLHAQTLQQVRGQVGTFFVEKPIFDTPLHNLENLGLGAEQKAYIAAPMRWCGVFIQLKKWLQGRKPYSVRALCSSYLPDWRKGVDYRTIYSAKREMGGGVTLDLIHEWDYLVDLFGAPLESFNIKGKYSGLEIDSDDLSVYIARYKDFVCELHLDYFGRNYRRDVEIFVEEGTVRADFGGGILHLPNGERVDCTEDVNRRYEREMAYFIEYAQHGSGASVNSPQKALQTVKLTLGDV